MDQVSSRGRSALGTGVFLAVLLVYCPTAYAYLDPGTGSALLYVITALVVSAYFAARGLYYQAVQRIFRARFGSQKCELAIHSEDPRYETTFLPVIRALAERNIPASYFTMYERDASYAPLPPQITHQAIPPGLIGYSYLNHLEAKVLVTTTPQLDVMMFRRSKRVRHYCHVPHALGESRFVRPFAYDFFDSVLCCGPLLEQNIRKIEAARQLPEKRLLKTGIPHYDELVKATASCERVKAPGTVLVAPSWGPMSLFTAFGTAFVRDIAERHPVVVRPHPQMKVSQPDLYQEILAIQGVSVDTSPTPAAAMSHADLLVSDISGIVYEFAFIHEKPVVIVDHGMGLGGLEGYLLGDTLSLREICADFIVAIKPAEIGSLAGEVDALLSRPVPKQIASARSRLVHNFGGAGAVAAEQIEEILKCL